MLKRNKEKGITLIALVVTIIVLLILAAVSLAMLTGENGILTNAKKSVTRTKSGSILERLELALTEYQTRKPFLNTDEERKQVLQEILEKIEGVQKPIPYDEETRKFTVVIEDETFLVDLDGNYEKRNITIKVDKQKVEGGMQVSVQIKTKDGIEKVELIKDETSTTLEAINNGSNYTCKKTVTEEGIYQIKVTTETDEETANVIIDLGEPQIVHSFNTEKNEINMTVTDNGSGISKIQVYQQTSETATSAVTEKIVEEFNYEDAPKSKVETSKITDITFGHYLRGYKIIATDVEGNPVTVQQNFATPIQTYIIMNEAQLKQFRASLTNSNLYAGKTVYLGADIELNKGKYTLDSKNRIPTFNADAEQWVPIGSSSAGWGSFQGTFDGQGHVIKGLYFNDASAANVGFFKATGANATVQNLGVIESYIVGGSFVGGIAGNGCGSSYIKNCYYIGVLGGQAQVGGITGHQQKIESCFADVDINIGKTYGVEVAGILGGSWRIC